jgi:oxygen-independent coproporphyrinogen-3 oxidase
MMLMGLRLSEGLDLRRWEALSRRTIDAEKEQFLTDLRFIERTGDGRLRCTPSGMMVLDAVVADLAM